MARIKLSPIITDVRGTLGDKLTFQRRGDGHYVVKKPHPRDTQSAAQLEQRTKFLDARDAWQGLSAEDKALWNEDARAGTNMTGYAYFIQQNINAPRGLPRQDILVDRWIAGVNTYTDVGVTPAVNGGYVYTWDGLVNAVRIEQPGSSSRPRLADTRPYGYPSLWFASDFMYLPSFNLPSSTAARTFAVIAEVSYANNYDSVFNWSFTNNGGQGCACVLRGMVDFNAYAVSFGSPTPAVAEVALHVFSAPDNATVDGYEYTLNGVSYEPTTADSRVVSTSNTQGCTLGFGRGQYFYGHVYAAALWDGYLGAEERESITPEMLLEVA